MCHGHVGDHFDPQTASSTEWFKCTVDGGPEVFCVRSYKNIHKRCTESYKMIELIVSCITVCGPPWGHLPHAGVLQDTHDPLDPVHGHTLLETAESWKITKLYRKPHELCWLRGRVCEAYGLCEMWTDSLRLWSGSVGSHKVWVWQRSQIKQFSEPARARTLLMPIRRLINSCYFTGDCGTVVYSLSHPCLAAQVWHCLFSLGYI